MTEVIVLDPGPPITVQVNDVTTVVNIVDAAGPQGPPGNAAPVVLQTDDTVVVGMAVYISGITGHFVRARADSFSTSNVIGLVSVSANSGFSASVERNTVSQSDWTAITGAAALIPGADYFLSPTTLGGLTTTPPTTGGQCVVHVGVAISTVELAISLDEPILL